MAVPAGLTSAPANANSLVSRFTGREILLVFVIFATAALLRGGYLMELRQNPDFDSPVLDPQLNDYWARAMVTGDWTPPAHAPDPEIRTTPFGRPPGYPYLLAAIYAVFGLDYHVPRVVQMLAGAMNAVLLYAFARALYGRLAAAFAGLLLAACWPCIYFEGELTSPVFEITVLLLLLHILRWWTRTGSMVYAVFAGLTVGCSALIRPNTMLLAPVTAAWMLLAGRCAGQSKAPGQQGNAVGGARRIMAALLLLAGSAAAVSPAIVRNYRVSGDLIFISYYGGVNAYIGNNPEADGVSPKVPDLRALSGLDAWNCFSYPQVVRGMALKQGRPGFDFADASRYFYGRALRYVKSRPLDALRLTVRKAALFWGPADVSDSKEVAFERIHSRVLRLLPGFATLLGLALSGLLATLCSGTREWAAPSRTKPQRRLTGVALILALTCFLSVLPFFVTARYRVPLLPILALFGGYGLSLLARLTIERRWGPLAVTAATAVLLVLLCNTTLAAYQPSLARWRIERGIAWEAKGKTAAAVQEFKSALEADPDSMEAHLHLGYAAAQRRDFDAALRHYQRAVWADPRNSLARNNLGFELARRGAALEAEQEYRAALASNPFSALTANNLGILLLDHGRLSEADNLLSQALAVHPHDPDLLNNLGLVHYRRGEFRQAGERFQAAVRVAPRHAKAWFNLGELFRTAQRLADAGVCYRKALDADPDFEAARQRLETLPPAPDADTAG